MLDVGHRGPNEPEDGSSTTTDEVLELEKRHRAQLLGLGAIALEMHQNDEIDTDLLTVLAADVAKTESQLRLLRHR